MNSVYKPIGKIIFPENIKVRERNKILNMALGNLTMKDFASLNIEHPKSIEIGIEFPREGSEQSPQPYLYYGDSKNRVGVRSGFNASLSKNDLELFKLLEELSNDERYKVTFFKGFNLNDIYTISFLERINYEQRLNRDHLTLIFKGLYDYIKYPNEDISTNKAIELSLLMERNVYEAEDALLKENGYPNISDLKSVHNQRISLKDDERKYYEWLNMFNPSHKTKNKAMDKPKVELLSKINSSLKSQCNLFKKIFNKTNDQDLSLDF